MFVECIIDYVLPIFQIFLKLVNMVSDFSRMKGAPGTWEQKGIFQELKAYEKSRMDENFPPKQGAEEIL